MEHSGLNIIRRKCMAIAIFVCDDIFVHVEKQVLIRKGYQILSFITEEQINARLHTHLDLA